MSSVEVNAKATWITKELISSEDYNKIYMFFVINSPVDGMSSRGKSFSDYGWKTPWRKPFCLRRQFNSLSNNKELIYSAQKYDNMDEALEKADLKDFPPRDIEKERVCIYNGKKTQYLSLFYHIRNSLAHGRFNIENDTFIMEDVAPRRKGMSEGSRKCSARMILKTGTLIKWIELIEGGPTMSSKYSKGYEVFAIVKPEFEDKKYTRKQLMDMIEGEVPNPFLPSDYCYNISNRDIKNYGTHEHYFEYTDDKKYIIRGENYNCTGVVKLKDGTIIGKWKDGVYIAD